MELRPARPTRAASSSRASRSSPAAFPLEAAEEVCDAELDDLGALVDYSLVKPIGDDRFFMLETIGEYALEKLREGSEEEELRRRHAAFFAALAEQAYDAPLRRGGRVVRAARDATTTTCAPHSTGCRRHDPDRALELAGALGWFWLSRGLVREGCGRLAAALAAPA